MSKTRKKVFIITNPQAGSMKVDKFIADISKIFSERNSDYKIYLTHPKEELTSTIRDAIEDGYDLIAAAGGDGTISMAASGLSDTGIPLGILPAGTGNVLAQGLSIPNNLEQAASLILGEHQLLQADAMRIGRHLYLLYVGVGLSSVMIEDASPKNKRRFGVTAYLWAAIKQLLGWQPIHFRLKIDGRRLSTTAIELGITNTKFAGARSFQWGEDIALDDRRVLVCIVRSKTFLDYLLTFFDLLLRRGRQSKYIHWVEARKWIQIETRAPLSVEADGEMIGKTPIEVEVIPHAISIIVPLNTSV